MPTSSSASLPGATHDGDSRARLASDPRFRVLRDGAADPDGRCVLYWMQRSQRGRDNPALNLAIDLGNSLRSARPRRFRPDRRLPRRPPPALPLPRRRPPRDRRRPRRPRRPAWSSGSAIPPRSWPTLAREARAAVVIGDENPVRIGSSLAERGGRGVKRPVRLRRRRRRRADSSLFPREEFAARTIRPKIHRVWGDYLVAIAEPARRGRLRP